MRKSKFFRLFTTLSEKEQEKFLQFVQLMYATQKKSVQLLQYISAYKKQENQEQYLDRAKAHVEVFDKEIVSKKEEKNILNALSDLTKWLENFFICESKDVSSFSRSFFVAKKYKERGLYQEYFGKLNYAKRESNKSNESYWTKLECFLADTYTYFDSEKDKHQLDKNLLLQADKQLERFYLLTKLKIACELESRNYIILEKTNDILHSETFNLIRKYSSENFQFRAYQLLYKLIKEQTEEAYNAFKQILEDNEFKDKALHLQYFSYVMNYLAIKIRNNEENYLSETFELYKLAIKARILVIQGVFHEMHFKNIVNFYCFFKDTVGARKFIDSFHKFLPKQARRSISTLCSVRIFYNERKFSSGIELLDQYVFENISYEIERKILKIQLLFEIDEYEIAEKNSINLENFLRRNKQISQSLKIASINFLKIIRRIINQKKKAHLFKTLKKNNFVAYRSWLMKKIALLPN